MDNRRTLFWLLFLGGAAVVALIPEYFFPAEEEALVVPPATRHGKVPAPIAAPLPVEAEALPIPAPVVALASGSGLFSPHSWRVEPPVAPAPAWTPPPPPLPAPPPPTAPALPFEFIGKLDDAEHLRVFLTRDEKIYTVTVGDVIDGTYRVERIDASEMILTYLPLNLTQTLSVGGKL